MSVSRRKMFSLRATASYAVFATAWILLSDQALSLFADPKTLTQFSTLKGLLFIAITALILWVALQNVPNDDATTLPESPAEASHPLRMVWGIVLPAIGGLMQWISWPEAETFTWLLLYPAVFLASWLGGRVAGLLATGLSTLIGWYVFTAPAFSWSVSAPTSALSIGIFFGMGVLFTLTHEWLRRSQQRATDNKFEALVEQSLAGIYIVQDGLFRYVNPEFARIMGYDSPDQIVNQLHVADLIAPEHRETSLRNIQRHQADMSQHMRYALKGRRRDGTFVDLEVHGRGIQTNTGTAVIGLAIDVSERLKTEAALRQSEQLLRAVVEGTSDAIFIKDKEGHYLMANQATADILGCTVQDILGHDDTAVFAPATARQLMARDQVILQEGRTQTTEEHLTTLDGTEWLFLVTKGPLLDAQGQVVGLFGMSRDITEIHQTRLALQHHQEQLEAVVQHRTAELNLARQEAEQLAQVKSEFLANMSHEIRTPLNGVLGLAQLGLQDTTSPSAHNLFGQIVQSGRLLLGVVNDILDFSKIEAGKLQAEAIPVNLRELLDRTLTPIRQRAHEQGLTVDLKLSSDLPICIESDPLRLEQILLNLLTNAIKFTRTGGITLRAQRQDNRVLIQVADTGIGMTEEQLANLFTPFTQADNSTTRRYGGTGLGLTITKRLVELLGGHIQVHSQAGQGATFDVSLPLTEAPSPAADSMPPAPATNLTPRAPAGGRLRGLRILAAEDNPVNQLVLGEFLRLEGAVATFVDTGQAAIDHVKNHPASDFDLILMDVQMPLVDGYEATRQIKAIAPDLIIIGQTAHAMQEERQKCLQAGMADMIVKPLDLDKVVQTICQHVTRAS